MHEAAQKFVKIIAKIPMFQGLTPGQVLEVLRAVESRTFSPKQVVCEVGSKSSEMYILLAGQLVVRSRDGMPLATIDPIVTVGEMGLITGHPRSATVTAVKTSNTLVLPKMKFDLLLRRSPEAGLTIFRNLIGTLTDRISENNKQVASYQRQLEALKQQFGVADTPAAPEPEEEGTRVPPPPGQPGGDGAAVSENGSAGQAGAEAQRAQA
jgi:CRP-like cAMP-binding protein